MENIIWWLLGPLANKKKQLLQKALEMVWLVVFIDSFVSWPIETHSPPGSSDTAMKITILKGAKRDPSSKG